MFSSQVSINYYMMSKHYVTFCLLFFFFFVSFKKKLDNKIQTNRFTGMSEIACSNFGFLKNEVQKQLQKIVHIPSLSIFFFLVVQQSSL